MKSNSTFIFFLAIFPGYFFYHVLKSTLYVPYVGWFSVVLLLCAVYYLGASFFNFVFLRPYKISLFITVPFVLLISSMVASTLVNQLLSVEEYITIEGSFTNVQVMVWMVALFQVGLHLEIPSNKIDGRWLSILLIAFAGCALYFFDPSTGSMLMRVLPGDNFEAANYQGMARSVIYTSLVLIPFVSKLGLRFVLIMLTVFTLYLIGSRTELMLFFIAIAIFILIYFRLRGAYALLLGLVVSLVGLLLSGFDIFGKVSAYVSGDASLNARSILLGVGIEGVLSSPIFGDYLGQVRDFGATGYYIHNALSMWQQHGLLPFILFIYLSLTSVLFALKLALKGRVDPYTDVLVALSITCLVGILTTKAISWPIPALAWGLTANVLARRRASDSSREQG